VNDEFCRLAGIQHRVISAYHPQANGLVERVQRDYVNGLRKTIIDSGEDWDILIFGIASANNASPKRAHNWERSPFELMFWRKPQFRLPLDFDLDEKFQELFALSKKDINEIVTTRGTKLMEMQNVVLRKAKKNILAEQVLGSLHFTIVFLGKTKNILR
jgi:hypothetical protein